MSERKEKEVEGCIETPTYTGRTGARSVFREIGGEKRRRGRSSF